MKQLKKCSLVLGIVSVLAAVPALQAQQTVPFYEPFPTSYGLGALLGTSPSVDIWTTGGGTGGGSPAFSNAPLSYLNLVTDASSYSLYLPRTATGTRNRGFEFDSATSGTLYASFLLDVQNAPTNNTRGIATLTSASGQSAGAGVMGVFINPNSQLQISKNATTTAGLAAGTTAAVNAPGEANLVVVRYTWNAGSNDDEFALWLNPTGLGGTAPAPDISTTTGNDFANLSWFFVIQRNNASIAGSDMYFDELRIGDTWAAVTPIPEPGSVALLGMVALGVVAGCRRFRK